MAVSRGSEYSADQMRRRLMVRLVGGLLLLLAVAMLPSLVISFVVGELDRGAFTATLLIIVPLGWGCFRYGRQTQGEIARREGFLLVTSAWLVSILVGAKSEIDKFFPDIKSCLKRRRGSFDSTF